MNLHIVIGEDDFLVSEAVKTIIAGRAPVEVIDSIGSGRAELQLQDLRAADSSFSTPPFFDPFKATWWKNVGFLPQANGKGCSAEVRAALQKFAERLVSIPLPENQLFVLSAPKMGKSEFAKILEKGGANIKIFAPEKPWERQRSAVARVVKMATAEGLAFGPGVAEKFVARVGCDTRSLMSELRKLQIYLGAKEKVITAATVDEVSSPGAGVEPEIWAVSDAIGARNVAAALKAARQFDGDSNYAVLMTTIMEKFFRQLCEVKDAMMRGNSESALQHLTPFAITKSKRFIANWSMDELRVARRRWMNLRERCVSGGGCANLLVDLEFVRSCMKENVR